MKKILVLADMEGCNGITDMSNYSDCKSKMESDVNRIIGTLYQLCDDCEIHLADCHNDGKSLSEYALQNGIIFYEQFWKIQDIGSYDAAYLVGFHPAKGHIGRFPHTIRPDIEALYLGETAIGEVSLLINWLSYYGIPVVFISGDEAILKEITWFPCVFWATNPLNIINKDDLEQKLHQSLMQENTHVIYDKSPVSIQLINDKYLEFLPSEIFTVQNNRIVFSDTTALMNSILELCVFLNIADSYQLRRIQHLHRIIKKNHISLHNNPHLENLFYHTEWRALSDSDVYLFYQEILSQIITTQGDQYANV